MNLPAHGTASPDPSKASSSVKTTHPESKNNSVSAWLGPLAARRNCSRPPGGIHLPLGTSVLPDPTVFSSPPGGAHRAARRQATQGPLTLVSSPGARTRAARRRISSRTPLVFLLWLVSQLSEVSST
ncbi:hypothetical protein DEO72_LG7g1717 [Vigna unguiculata]|uniref:Uncharacterized protein n=1 Tax=Vigna unguiculata TaxID=3917 RepID=A0A4D6MKA1_VIGUN|nr:hypothetical protein DEO72_LG7g1717 [Vigna unguiculata]